MDGKFVSRWGGQGELLGPGLAQVLDFLEALASGACMDRGKGLV